jgi:DeoR/GlpR family transcriptional regulator of sugar metabolism
MPQPSPRARLSQQDRQANILALLRRDGVVRIATLARLFDVTTETARRDLDELAGNGALQRTYGGGASRSLIDEPGIGLRGLVHAPERTRIAPPRRRWSIQAMH